MTGRKRVEAVIEANTAPLSANRLLETRRPAPGDTIDRVLVTFNLAESPLAWLVRRGMVTALQFEASERVRGDFMRAGQAPRVTIRWDPSPTSRSSGNANDPSTAQIAARQRFDAAVAAVGPGLSDVLWRVVCMGEGLEVAERALGWPDRAGKLVLKLALDRLAAHYGLGDD